MQHLVVISLFIVYYENMLMYNYVNQFASFVTLLGSDRYVGPQGNLKKGTEFK